MPSRHSNEKTVGPTTHAHQGILTSLFWKIKRIMMRAAGLTTHACQGILTSLFWKIKHNETKRIWLIPLSLCTDVTNCQMPSLHRQLICVVLTASAHLWDHHNHDHTSGLITNLYTAFIILKVQCSIREITPWWPKVQSSIREITVMTTGPV